MSPRTRELLPDRQHLTDIIIFDRGVHSLTRRFYVAPYRFSHVWESRDGVVVAIHPAPLRAPESVAFIEIQTRLLEKLCRLLAAEQSLRDIARSMRRGAGHLAIRQIELDRKRLGRELHTGVGQLLAAIKIQLEVIGGEMPVPEPRVKQALEGIAVLAKDALQQVRDVSRRVHPPEWQRLTLGTAIQQLWDVSGIPQRFDALLEIHPLPQEPVQEVKAVVYRAFQEALSNLVQHSNATRIEVRLSYGPALILTVADNGVGFDAAGHGSAPASIASGVGIRSIREQVQELGGKFDIESSPLGTKLVVSLALSPPAGQRGF
jgi:signal transduction histidine kinase